MTRGRCRRADRLLLVTVLLWTLSACSILAGPVCAAEPLQRVDLRFLLLGTGRTRPLRAWESALTREGVPFDVVLPTQDPLTRAQLEPAPGHARYEAVVHATDDGPVRLPPDQQALLDAYLDEFNLREVVAFGAPPDRRRQDREPSHVLH